MIQTRGWRRPRGMVAHLRDMTLQPAVQQHGFAATILGCFIFPFMLHHPRPALSVEAKPITTKTLTLLMRWHKVARVKYDAEVRGLPPAQARATADQGRDLVRRK